ncbi:MAG: hypothetical protein QM703_11885 [Gemmatales bacterium]
MSKRLVSNLGKGLFFIGFVMVVLGAMAGGMVFIVPMIGFALILLSFGCLAYGSRVGDEQN